MKKDIIRFFKHNGFSCSYSGNTRTMYIHGISKTQLDDYIMLNNLPFKLVAD